MAPTRPSGKGAMGKRKPRKSRFSITPKKRGPRPAAAREKTRRKRSSQTQPEPTSSRTAEPQAERSQGRKRKAKEAEFDELAEGEPATQKYKQLAPARRRIPQQTIDTWSETPPQLLEQISRVLRDAKKKIAHDRGDPRKIDEAEDALNALVRGLERHLSTSRVPPLAKEMHFNVEKLTERNAQLSEEVTTARHTNQLLEEQVNVAHQFLNKEEKKLEQLKKNAKQWKAQWKQQQRGQLHPLLRDSENDEMEGDGPGDVGFRKCTPIDSSMFDAPETELAPLVEQLRRSLGTMQGDHAPVGGIQEAMREAEVALDEVLFRHASAQQYDAL